MSGLLVLSWVPGSALAQEPLVAQLEIFQVQQQMVSGRPQERLTEVQSVEPGIHLEYVLRYRNVSQQSLAGFDIRTPIPLNTHYLPDSARSSVPGLMQVSLDGGQTWRGNPPLQASIDAQGNLVTEPVPVQQYTDLRWSVSELLAPQAEVEIRYRVQVQ